MFHTFSLLHRIVNDMAHQIVDIPHGYVSPHRLWRLSIYTVRSLMPLGRLLGAQLGLFGA